MIVDKVDKSTHKLGIRNVLAGGGGVNIFLLRVNMADAKQQKANITHVIFDMDGLLLGK